MKNSSINLLITCVVILTLFSCAQEKKQNDKITDITVTTKSTDAMASFREGLKMSDNGDRQKARELFSKAIEQDPKLAIAYVMRAVNSNSGQDFVADLNKAKEMQDSCSNWEKWYYGYNETFLTSDWNKRMEIAKTIADSFPDAPRAQVDLGATYSQGNDEAKARECYQKAIDMDSNWIGAVNAMVVSYLFLEPRDFKKAETYALKSVALAPTSPAAEIALGDCYRAQNDLAKARDAYAKAIELDPSPSEAYYKKGHANTYLGNYDEARQNYADAGTHDVSKFAANQVGAYTYLYAGDFKTAQNMLMAYAMKEDSSGGRKDEIDNNKLNYLNDCQRIAMHHGDAAGLKSLMAMTEPLQMEVANEIATPEAKLLAQGNVLYYQSVLAALEGNYDDAKAKAEQIKTTLESITDPNKLDQYHVAMGFISMQQKNYGDAVSHFSDAHPGNSVYTKYWFAKANEAAGNKDKAEALYNEIAVYNFNGIDYALIRNEVVARKPAM